MNGKLVIRVGGGYMIIEEFIATYGDSEMIKIAKMSDEQLAALAHDSVDSNIAINPNARLSMYRQKIEGIKSPTASGSNINQRLADVVEGR